MKKWTNKKRTALKSAAGTLARMVGGLVRRSDPFPLPTGSQAAPPASAPPESSASGSEHRRPHQRKPSHRAALAVEDGFKEF